MQSSDINFVADIADKRRKMLAFQRIAKLSLLSSTVCLMGTTFLCGVQQSQARREMVMAEKQMRLHQPAIGEMEAIQAATAGQRPRVQLLADARKMSLRWCVVMNAIASRLPAGTRLDQMEATGGESTQLMLRVETTSQTLAAKVATELAAHPIFTQVDIRSTQASDTVDTATKVKLELAVTLRGNTDLTAPIKASGKSGGARRKIGGPESGRA
ncbi:MAG: PilN domain-containing protein [Armatimonadaceae bacterium]